MNNQLLESLYLEGRDIFGNFVMCAYGNIDQIHIVKIFTINYKALNTIILIDNSHRFYHKKLQQRLLTTINATLLSKWSILLNLITFIDHIHRFIDPIPINSTEIQIKGRAKGLCSFINFVFMLVVMRFCAYNQTNFQIQIAKHLIFVVFTKFTTRMQNLY